MVEDESTDIKSLSALEELLEPKRKRYSKALIHKAVWLASKPRELTREDWLNIIKDMKQYIQQLEEHAKAYNPISTTKLQIEDEGDHAYELYILRELLQRRIKDAESILH